jgi:DNA-binding CsgD family transcriptional regulator
VTSLLSLGLTEDQERLYRHLLRNLGSDVDTAGAELLMPNARSVAADLRAMGLIDDTSTPVTPAIAVDLLVRHRLERTRRQLTGLTLAWDVLTELTEEHRSGRTVHVVEHVRDGPALAQRVLGLLTDEPGELAQVAERVPDHQAGSAAAPFAGLLARGLRSRTLVPARALEDPDRDLRSRRWHAAGDLHRVTAEPVRQVTLVNRAVAFVRADPAHPGGGVVQIRQRGVVALLVDAFDGMWSRARELDDCPLSPIEQSVLNALTSHNTDEAAARSLNVSVRKFRGHVADLMAKAGVSTRFQVALAAQRRGWL